MHIYLRLAEPFWRAIGQRNIEIEVDDKSTVRDLLDNLCHTYPNLRQELETAPPHIFIGEEEVDLECTLCDGNQVYLLWAISGG